MSAAPAIARPRPLLAGIVVAMTALVAAAAGCKRDQPASTPPAAAPAPPPVAAPAAESPPAPTPAVTIHAGQQPALFHVQVATTAEERANGLRDRPTMASDTGILFVFDRAEKQTLSTKDNLLATDIIFIGADRHIVGIIEGTRPLGTARYRVPAPSRYVLEIRGGLSARMGFKVGQSVEFRAIPGT